MRPAPEFTYRVVGEKVGKETTSSLGRSEEMHLFSLASDGLDCVAGIGRSRINVSRAHFPQHIHPHCLEMHYCLRGSLVFQAEGQEYRCMPGQVFLTQPKDRHHLVERQRGQRHFWLLFRFPSRHGGTILDLPAKESSLLCRRLAGIRRRLFPADASLRDLFQKVFDLCDEPRCAFRDLELKSLILRILLVVLRCAEREGTARSSVNSRIQDVIRDIRENPARKHSIEELAHRAALSESRFSFLFKHATGLPPHAFMASCRIVEAKRLLRATGEPISKIARNLGFASSRHLTAQFRQFCSMTPSRFRKGTRHSIKS